MQPQTNLGPGAAISQMAGVTVTTMILIAIGVVLAILVIWWGAKKKRQRKAAERELVQQGGVRDGDTPVEEGDVSAPPTATPAPSPAIRNDPPASVAMPAEAKPAAPTPRHDPVPPRRPTPAVAPPPAEAPIAADAPSPPPPPIAPPAGGDDLTQMKGVGPKLAMRLNELGITRYADIAALDPAAAEALDAELGAFRGRLTRDRWIEQAKYLAAGDRQGFEAEFGRL